MSAKLHFLHSIAWNRWCKMSTTKIHINRWLTSESIMVILTGTDPQGFRGPLAYCKWWGEAPCKSLWCAAALGPLHVSLEEGTMNMWEAHWLGWYVGFSFQENNRNTWIKTRMIKPYMLFFCTFTLLSCHCRALCSFTETCRTQGNPIYHWPFGCLS